MTVVEALRAAISFRVVRDGYVVPVKTEEAVAVQLYRALRNRESFEASAVIRGVQTRPLSAEEAARIVRKATEIAVAQPRGAA